MTGALSVRTYSACLFSAGDRTHNDELARALGLAGRRLWTGAFGVEAFTRVRSIVIAIGRNASPGLEVAKTTLRRARETNALSLPVLAVLLPDCDANPRSIETVLDSPSTVIDLRHNASERAIERVAGIVPVVCQPRGRVTWHGFDPIKAAVVDSYDAIAGQFTEVWAAYPPYHALEKLLALMPKRSEILDAGCGPGHHAKYLEKRGHCVTGIDLSRRMLEIARRSNAASRVVRMDMEHLEVNAKFHGIWCAGSAMHIPRERMPRLLKRFRRALTDGGVLGINLQIGRTSEVAVLDNDRRYFEYYSDAAEIAGMLDRAGFEVLDGDYGETGRNTHAAPVRLKWQTLYACRRRDLDVAAAQESEEVYDGQSIRSEP